LLRDVFVNIFSINHLRYIILIVVGIIWSIAIISTRNIRLPDRFHGLVAVFFGWATLSAMWSLDVSRTIDIIPSFLLILGILGLIWDNFRTVLQVELGLQTVVLAASVLVVLVIRNFLSGQPVYPGRYSGGGLNPNVLATIVVLSIPIAWYLSTSSSLLSNQRKFSFTNLIYIPLAFAVIFLTGSRQAMVACIPVLGAIVWTLQRQHNIFKLWMVVFTLSSLLFIGATVAPEYILERAVSVPAEIISGNFGTRIIQWQAGWELFANQPFRGIGSHAFHTAIESLIGRNVSPDNTYLTVLYELGVVGFILFGIILVRIWGLILYLDRSSLILWTTMVLTFVLLWLVNDWMKPPLMWILFGLITAHAAAQSQANYWNKSRG
jgi:O-antigen ligase